jgi:hypothetical protein
MLDQFRDKFKRAHKLKEATLFPPQEGDTALILSAANGRLDAVRLLLDSKTNIQEANKVSWPHHPSWLLFLFPTH